MGSLRLLCDEISDLLMDIRVMRAHAQLDLYATATAFMPQVPPAVDAPAVVVEAPAVDAPVVVVEAPVVCVLETAEERVMREDGERLLAEAEAEAAESDARWLAGHEADAAANAHTLTRTALAAEYAAHVERQYLAAEDCCRGVLLTRAAHHAGVDPRTLFSGPTHVAHARASEELRQFWAYVEPRLTRAEFDAHVTGRWTPAAETARNAAHNARHAA